MKYEVLLLDADGTLFDFDEAEKYALENTYRYLGIPYGDFHLKLYKEINKQAWQDFEKGKISLEELKIGRFKKLFDGQNMDYDKVSTMYLNFLGEGNFELKGAREVCMALSQNYRLVIVTNGTASVQEKRFKNSSIIQYIEAMVISENTGSKKPEPAIFEYTLNKIGHKDKSSVLTVGDSLTSDIQGGINAGIDTCWYNSKGNPNTYQIIPTYEINHLEELLTLLL